MRKSFIIHNDSLSVLDDLTDDQCGELFKAIKAYQLGESIDLSPIVKVAFSPFKNQFQRDDEKYQNIVERNKHNGSKGGRPKNPKEPSGLSGNPEKPQKADSDSDSDSDSVSKSKSDSKYSSEDYSLSVAMYELICYVAPHTKKPNYEKWADTIRLIREVDGIPIDTIQQVFKWANTDSFWRTNILSPSKLRKQFNQLQAKMVNNNGQQNQSGRTTAPSRQTPAQRTRAAAERWEAEQEGNVQALGGDAGSLRAPVEQPVRGGADGDMGATIDGDFTRAD